MLFLRRVGARLGSRRVRCVGTAVAVRAAALQALVLPSGCVDLEPPVPLPGEEAVPYPITAWEEGTEGEVLVRVLVTAAGVVDSVEMHEESGVPALDSAALEGAWGIRFDPARKGSEPVAAWVLVPVRFEQSASTDGAAPSWPPSVGPSGHIRPPTDSSGRSATGREGVAGREGSGGGDGSS